MDDPLSVRVAPPGLVELRKPHEVQDRDRSKEGCLDVRDILYNNAARFLRLSEEEIARHHGR